MYETRRIERQDSVVQFKTEIDKIVDALTEISTWNEQVSAPKQEYCYAQQTEVNFYCLCFAFATC